MNYPRWNILDSKQSDHYSELAQSSPYLFTLLHFTTSWDISIFGAPKKSEEPYSGSQTLIDRAHSVRIPWKFEPVRENLWDIMRSSVVSIRCHSSRLLFRASDATLPDCFFEASVRDSRLQFASYPVSRALFRRFRLKNSLTEWACCKQRTLCASMDCPLSHNSLKPNLL